MAGAPAFNAISRSSLLLAQHPEDEHRRVLVRGKGNLSQTPPAVEFAINSHQFTANGHQFNVPLATDFTESTMTVDDLVGTETAVHEHSKIADACDIINTLLPHDGEWHPAKPIYDACATEEIDERTAKRAKARLEVEHRRTQTFPATVEWRWPPTPDTHRTPVHAVSTVPTVPSANGHKPPLSSSEDTQDRQDHENTRPHCVPTGDLTDDEIEALANSAQEMLR
jgi:hypothetical protein